MVVITEARAGNKENILLTKFLKARSDYCVRKQFYEMISKLIIGGSLLEQAITCCLNKFLFSVY